MCCSSASLINLSPGLQYKIIVYAENGVSSQSYGQRSAEVLVSTETTGLFVFELNSKPEYRGVSGKQKNCEYVINVNHSAF